MKKSGSKKSKHAKRTTFKEPEREVGHNIALVLLVFII